LAPLERNQLQDPLERKLAHVVRRNLAPNDHAPVNFLDGKVTDSTVSRFQNPVGDAFG
jgi:hypothetical protein